MNWSFLERFRFLYWWHLNIEQLFKFEIKYSWIRFWIEVRFFFNTTFKQLPIIPLRCFTIACIMHTFFPLAMIFFCRFYWILHIDEASVRSLLIVAVYRLWSVLCSSPQDFFLAKFVRKTASVLRLNRSSNHVMLCLLWQFALRLSIFLCVNQAQF